MTLNTNAGTGDGGAGSGDATGLLPADDGGEPTGPVSLEDVAAAFDAEAVGAGGDAGKGEGGDAGQGDDQPPSTDPVDEFITQNYGGNRAAFVASLHESRQEAKRLATEVELLKRGQAPTPRDPVAELKAARAADPEVQALDQEIKSISDENRVIGTRQLELATQASSLQAKIAEQETQLLATGDDSPKELAKVQSALSRSRTELASLLSEFQTNQVRQANNVRDERRLGRELAKAEKDLRAQMEMQEREVQTEEVERQRTRSHFTSAFTTQIEQYGLDPKSERFKFAQEATRTMLADYLESLGDAPRLDAAGITEAVGKLVQAYARSHGLQARTGALAARKPATQPARTVAARQVMAGRSLAAASTPSPNPTTPTTPRTPDEALSNPDYVRRRATAVFQAAARNQARGLRGGRGMA